MKTALHLLDSLRFGGAENVARNYAYIMRTWGIDTLLVGRIHSEEFARSAGEVCRIREHLSLRQLKAADLIFIHTNRRLLQVFLCLPLLRKRGKQILYIQHLPYPAWKFRLLALLINRTCSGFIRITPQTERLVERYIHPPIHFIPNFYPNRYRKEEYQAIRRSVRREAGIPEEAIVLLFSGVLRPGKGLDHFLELARRMSDDPRYSFWVVGEGQEGRKIAEYSGRNMIGFGWSCDVERYLIAADVYCFLSRHEMMPMALIEAMNAGRKIAALSSPVNDFLLPGDTYPDISEIEMAIRKDTLPAALPRYDEQFAREKLKALLPKQHRRKLLHIQVQPKLTGVQRISLELFRSLPEETYKKQILFGDRETGGDRQGCLDAFRATGAQVRLSPHLRREIGWHDLRAFRDIYRLCRRERFDIVHTHSTKPGIIGRIAARLAGVPQVIHTVHGIAFHRYEKLFKRLFYYTCEVFASFFSHRITLVSRYYERYYPWLARKVCVIPNGIDYTQLPPPPNRPYEANAPVREQHVRLLFVGRADSPKDPLTLLEAFRRIVEDHQRKNVTLTMVGDGPLLPECHRFIRQHRLEKNVTLTGWQSNVAPYYMNHDIFCLSSIYESFGLCLLEAGYYGLPSVATRVEGVPEVLAENETGFLVPPRDPQAMADKILRLIDNAGERDRMGELAHKRVTERFGYERMTEEYKQLYNRRKYEYSHGRNRVCRFGNGSLLRRDGGSRDLY